MRVRPVPSTDVSVTLFHGILRNVREDIGSHSEGLVFRKWQYLDQGLSFKLPMPSGRVGRELKL
jgi:hypothetical protein